MLILRLLLLTSLLASTTLFTNAGGEMDPNGQPSQDAGGGVDPNGASTDGGPGMDPNG